MKIQDVVERFEESYKGAINPLIMYSNHEYIDIFAELLLKQQGYEVSSIDLKKFNKDYDTVFDNEECFNELEAQSLNLKNNNKAFLLIKNIYVVNSSNYDFFEQFNQFRENCNTPFMLSAQSDVCYKFYDMYPDNIIDVDYDNLNQNPVLEKIHLKVVQENYLNNLGIENYTINDDSTVDVNGSVDISNKELYNLDIKFGVIEGDFNCSHNNLPNLRKMPEYVGGTFNCSYNEIVLLQNIPKVIVKDCKCEGNPSYAISMDSLSIGGNLSLSHSYKQEIFNDYYEGSSLFTSQLLLDIPFDKYREILTKPNEALNEVNSSKKYGMS